MLTLEKLKKMKPSTRFGQGYIEDSPAGINMANTGKTIKWVAVRGDIHDWAIYSDNPYSPQNSFQSVAELGDKVGSVENIKKLVPCDDEAFEMYSY